MVDIRCRSRNLYGFWMFLGFHSFLRETLWASVDLYRFWIRWCSWAKKRYAYVFYLRFNRRFELESSRTLEFDSVCWFLAWIPKINRWFLFFFFFTGSNPLNFLPSSSHSSLCDRVEFAAFSGEFTLELQGKWFGDDESLRIVVNFTALCLNLILEN